MKPWTTVFRLGWLPVLLLTSSLRAQDLGVGIPGAAAAPAPAAAASGGFNVFKAFLPPPEARERCRQKLCKCEIVKLLRNAMAPMSMATGGLIKGGNCCPEVRKEDLLKPADSSEGAAARIKKDLEEAGARREAMRFLGTVDCRYWPEAEDALILGLRGDKIECVRFEAALALQRGCCCTKKVAKALTITIEGSDKDGFPAERSQRVIDAAAMALSMCVIEEPAQDKAKTPEAEAAPKKIARVDPREYYQSLDKMPREQVLQGARKVLTQRGNPNPSQVLAHPHRASSNGLFGMIGYAYETANDPQQHVQTQHHHVQAQHPTRTATPCDTAAAPQRRGLIYKIMPGLAGDDTTAFAAPSTTEPQMAPRSDIRQASWISGTAKVNPITQTGFSTANSPSGVIPAGASCTTCVPATSTTPQTRQDNGVLGFVIMDETSPNRGR